MKPKTRKSTSPVSALSSSRFVNLEDIGRAYDELSPKFAGRKEDYFGPAYISKKFKISIEEAASFVNFGGHSYGIDGFFYDTGGKSLYLFVFRWSDDHMSFKAALDALG